MTKTVNVKSYLSRKVKLMQLDLLYVRTYRNHVCLNVCALAKKMIHMMKMVQRRRYVLKSKREKRSQNPQKSSTCTISNNLDSYTRTT